MRSPRSLRAPAGLTLGLIVLASGCGSQTHTVTIASSPARTQATATTPSASPAPAPASTPTTSAPAPRVSTTTTPAAPTTTTRQAPEPVFTERQSKAPEGAKAAAAVIRSHGFTARNLAEYHPDQALRVLVGTRTGGPSGAGEEAFFFLDGRYLGTDSSRPSASITVVSQADTEVTISYRLYRPGQGEGSPGAGTRLVSFQLDNGQLSVLGKVPPAHSSSGLSRR